jgi:hypothetical protein
MPRAKDQRGTTAGPTGTYAPTTFEKSSAAAAASVDILDSEMATASGFTPTTDQFTNDFDVVRVPHTTPGDEAAATIGIASVLRNAGNTGFTVTFTATAAAGKIVRVRVIPR